MWFRTLCVNVCLSVWEHIEELTHTIEVLTKFCLGVTNQNFLKKHIKMVFSKIFLEKLVNFNLSITFIQFFSYWIINSLNCLDLLKVDWLWKELFYNPLWGHPLKVVFRAVLLFEATDPCSGASPTSIVHMDIHTSSLIFL